jgi:hypothetical protein
MNSLVGCARETRARARLFRARCDLAQGRAQRLGAPRGTRNPHASRRVHQRRGHGCTDLRHVPPRPNGAPRRRSAGRVLRERFHGFRRGPARPHVLCVALARSHIPCGVRSLTETSPKTSRTDGVGLVEAGRRRKAHGARTQMRGLNREADHPVSSLHRSPRNFTFTTAGSASIPAAGMIGPSNSIRSRRRRIHWRRKI